MATDTTHQEQQRNCLPPTVAGIFWRTLLFLRAIRTGAPSMIRSVTLRFGPSGRAPNLRIDTDCSVNLFIGPNNSGKSLALEELNAAASGAIGGKQPRIIDSIEYAPFDADKIDDIISSLRSEPKENEIVPKAHAVFEINGQRSIMLLSPLSKALQNPNERKGYYGNNFIRYYIINLNGHNRLSLVNPSDRGDLKRPSSLLGKLLMDDRERKSLRDKVFAATGLYFAIDIFVGSQLEVKFSETEPLNERELSNLNADYMRDARSVSQVSDGIKAYTGILMYMHFGSGRVLFIDEPEAFLHPSLSFSLGKEIGASCSKQSRTVFCSTHSSHFLMGCVASGARINITRLTYSNGVPTARSIASDKLYEMLNDPILRSSNIMSGLFYDGVVVAEADADRAFYSEINERLLRSSDPRGTPHTLFVNSNGKHSIHRLVGPLRDAGIPAAAIIDIDLLADNGPEFTNILRSINIPEIEHDAYRSRRATIHQEMIKSNSDFKRNGGINVLTGASLEAARNLMKDLARYGLFVVPSGEIEAWLPDLVVKRSKHKWLYSIFSAMGNMPTEPGYVEPSDGDVWDFIGGVSSWVHNPHRLGMPS